MTKKNYEELWNIIDKQNKQIEELINMVIEANARTNHATKCFFDLVDFVDIRFNILPPEAKKLVDEMLNDLYNRES